MQVTNVTSLLSTPDPKTLGSVELTTRLMDNISTFTHTMDGNVTDSLAPAGRGGAGFPELRQARTLSIVYGIFSIIMGVSGNLLTVITIGK